MVEWKMWLGCAGLGWAGLGWAGLGWAGLHQSLARCMTGRAHAGQHQPSLLLGAGWVMWVSRYLDIYYLYVNYYISTLGLGRHSKYLEGVLIIKVHLYTYTICLL